MADLAHDMLAKPVVGRAAIAGTYACSSNHWLGVQASHRMISALATSAAKLLDSASVTQVLVERGIAEDMIEVAIKSDLYRIAHALTVLVEQAPEQVLATIIPDHLQQRLQGAYYRLDHVGSEVLCPLAPLLDALRGARDLLGFQHPASHRSGRQDLTDKVFPSVQVVEALRREDPTLVAVTIAKSFLQTRALDKPVHVELFFPGRNDGSDAQHVSYMEQRLAALIHDPRRRTFPVLPICHLSAEIEDYSLLEDIHRLGQTDRSGLVSPYCDDISINPADGSHNTKLAVRKSPDPSAPVNVLEFVYFI